MYSAAGSPRSAGAFQDTLIHPSPACQAQVAGGAGRALALTLVARTAFGVLPTRGRDALGSGHPAAVVVVGGDLHLVCLAVGQARQGYGRGGGAGPGPVVRRCPPCGARRGTCRPPACRGPRGHSTTPLSARCRASGSCPWERTADARCRGAPAPPAASSSPAPCSGRSPSGCTPRHVHLVGPAVHEVLVDGGRIRRVHGAGEDAFPGAVDLLA